MSPNGLFLPLPTKPRMYEHVYRRGGGLQKEEILYGRNFKGKVCLFQATHFSMSSQRIYLAYLIDDRAGGRVINDTRIHSIFWDSIANVHKTGMCNF